MFSVENRDRLLGFRFDPAHRNLRRSRALHYSRPDHRWRNDRGNCREFYRSRVDEHGFASGCVRSCCSRGGARLRNFVIVLEGGKIAFGRKRVKLIGPTPFTWTRHGDDADFIVGEERSLWSDYFAREKDRLLLHCDEAKIDNRVFGNTILEFHYNRVGVGTEEFVLDTVDRIFGVAHELEIPREAMGRGDLKFLAAIGDFLGWRGVLFSIFAGSVVA